MGGALAGEGRRGQLTAKDAFLPPGAVLWVPHAVGLEADFLAPGCVCVHTRVHVQSECVCARECLCEQ